MNVADVAPHAPVRLAPSRAQRSAHKTDLRRGDSAEMQRCAWLQQPGIAVAAGQIGGRESGHWGEGGGLGATRKERKRGEIGE
eukprot:6190926-Pleurochrysis_carterae.AAC.3